MVATKGDPNWNGYGDSTNTDAYVFAGYDGTNAGNFENYVWYKDNSNSLAHEVKGKLPNSYGLYDMSGNVREWCYDKYRMYISANSWSGISSHRVYRGGSLSSGNSACSVSYRSGGDLYSRNVSIGFRVVRTASAE